MQSIGPPGSAPPTSDVSGLSAAGWRQCSILPANLAAELQLGAVDDLVLVASHDCDVCNKSLEQEPEFEVIVAKRLTGEIDGNLTWGKNPRRLQIEACESAFELDLRKRITLKRERLVGKAPDPRRLPDNVVRAVQLWLGKRYYRSAFADTFNERMSGVQKRIAKLLQRKGRDISGVYFSLSDEELPPKEAYNVIVRGTMTVADYQNPRKRADSQEALDKIVGEMKDCDGIEVVDHKLESEADVTLDDLHLLHRWDAFEHQSAPNLDPIAPRPA